MFDNIAIEKNKFYHHIIGKVLVANKISFDEKNYYFVGYLYNGNKVKPLNTTLPKTSAYISYYGQNKLCIFWLKMMTYQKNIILFGIKAMLISKKNLIASLSLIKFFENQNKSQKVDNYYLQVFLKECKYIEKK